jgi:hypothetical protein
MFLARGAIIVLDIAYLVLSLTCVIVSASFASKATASMNL